MDWFLLILLILSIGVIFTLMTFLKKAMIRIAYYEKWTEEFVVRLFDTQTELKRIDASGHFEADDEVGYFFKALKDLMNRLYELGVLDEEEIETSKKNQQIQLSTEEINQVLANRSRAKVSQETQTQEPK